MQGAILWNEGALRIGGIARGLGSEALMLDRGCLGWDTCLCGAVLYELRRGWPDRVGSEVFP